MKDTLSDTRTVAQLVVDCLEANGVTTVFGVPGEETTDLMQAIDRSDLTFVLCRHEQAAAFMASVHGRLTGRPAVCLATLGPGAINLVTGVADATLDHVPLIAVTGQGARARLGKESHQVIDLAKLFNPISKSSRRLVDPAEVPQAIAEAVRLSTAEKPGAVHLSLPEDLAAEPTTLPTVVAPNPATVQATDADVGRARDVIATAKRPLIVAGHGVIRSDASEKVHLLAEHLSAPVLTTFMAKGILPPDHPLNLQTVGQPESDVADDALSCADLIVAIGFDAVEYPPEALTNDGAASVVHIAETRPQADAGWPVKAHLIGDLSANLDRLSNVVPRGKGTTWFEPTRDRIHAALARKVTPDDAHAFAPQDICRIVSHELRDDDLLLSGVGLHKLWIARHVVPRKPAQVIIPNGLAGMGLALPGAIEAARLRKRGRVIAICGDGDFMMNVQEMETAARMCLPVTVMIWEDGGYGLIDEKQGGNGPTFAFGNPEWSDLARAFGWVYADVQRLDDVGDALRHGADAAVPTLVRVSVDYNIAGGMPHTER